MILAWVMLCCFLVTKYWITDALLSPHSPWSYTQKDAVSEMDGRCEVECLSFEDKIGGCRAELTPLCCKKKKGRIIKSQAGATGSEKQRSSGCELHAANISGFILLTSNMGIL